MRENKKETIDVDMTEFIELLVNLAKLDGVIPFHKYINHGKLWERRIGSRWILILNPHNIAIVCEDCAGGDGMMIGTIQPGCIRLFYNGWVAGDVELFTRHAWIANGDVANIDSLLIAMKGKINGNDHKRITL